MVKHLSVLVLACTFQVEPTLAKEVLIESIVATVNGEPILHSEIIEKTTKGPLVNISDYPAGPGAKESLRALYDSINYKLMLQAADDMKIAVSGIEVEEQIDRFIANQNAKAPAGQKLDRASLIQMLKSQGKTYNQYKQDFANQIKLQRFQGQRILPTVKVTDEEIQSYYQQIAKNAADSVIYDLEKILVQDKSTAEKVYKEARSTANFEKIVAKYTASKEDYKLSQVKLQDLPAAVADKIKSLGISEISEPVQTSAGYFIFKVISKKISKDDSQFMAIKDRLRQEIQTKELISATHTWLADQRKISKIEIRKN